MRLFSRQKQFQVSLRVLSALAFILVVGQLSCSWRRAEGSAVDLMKRSLRPAKILWVNQAAELVWIDLGRRDGVKKEMVFSVHGNESTTLGNAEIKVVRVGPAMCECCIVSDHVTRPIGIGDRIALRAAGHSGRRTELPSVVDAILEGRRHRSTAETAPRECRELNYGITKSVRMMTSF